ncbi:MAG: transglycosylase SLT domain-containing protein [Dehalococcoidia bacterium]|nr:transglycosylase SLT domain-containing protein [Dehalococcoidia bacterium]
MVFAATSGSVGTFALGGFDPSVANAPILGSSDDGTIVVQGLASDGRAEPPEDPPSSGVSSSDEPEDDAGDGDGDGPLAFLDEMPRTLTAGEVRILAREAGWPESRLDEVVAVARCESTLNPRARNAANSRVYGLMQVHRLWFDYAGISLSQWHDPLVNLRVALAAFNYDIARGNPPLGPVGTASHGAMAAGGGRERLRRLLRRRPRCPTLRRRLLQPFRTRPRQPPRRHRFRRRSPRMATAQVRLRPHRLLNRPSPARMSRAAKTGPALPGMIPSLLR